MPTQTTRAPRKPSTPRTTGPAKTSKVSKVKPRSARSDGVEKRNHILEVAGSIYAQKGFARTTSREICVAAGTDMAAVNYHFGNKDGLYGAILVEAHAQFIKLDDLEAIAQSDKSAESKLRALIGLLVERSSGTTVPWGLRVLLHELMAPSAHLAVMERKAALPKVQLIMTIVADVLGVQVKHPVVQRSVAFVVMPCIMMVIAPQEIIQEILPGLKADRQALVDDMMRYALAGLKSLAKQYRAAKAR